jgi:hypothetical protein
MIGVLLVIVVRVHAEDISFEKTKLSSPNDFKESLVELRIGDSRITVQPQTGSTATIDISYATVTRIAYAFTNRRRLLEGAVIAPVLMLTKAQSHWLVVEWQSGAAQQTTLLHLHKSEYRGVISALNAKSGKRVEMLDPDSALVDPTVDSHDIDETVPYPIDRVSASLKPVMESLGCKITKQKDNQIECHREHKHIARTGFGGEVVTAKMEANGENTHIEIKTSRGLGRNWSSPIYRVMRKQLESGGTSK